MLPTAIVTVAIPAIEHAAGMGVIQATHISRYHCQCLHMSDWLQVAGLWLVMAFFTALALLLLGLSLLCSKRRSWVRVRAAPHTAGAHLPRLKSMKTFRHSS